MERTTHISPFSRATVDVQRAEAIVADASQRIDEVDPSPQELGQIANLLDRIGQLQERLGGLEEVLHQRVEHVTEAMAAEEEALEIEEAASPEDRSMPYYIGAAAANLVVRPAQPAEGSPIYLDKFENTILRHIQSTAGVGVRLEDIEQLDGIRDLSYRERRRYMESMVDDVLPRIADHLRQRGVGATWHVTQDEAGDVAYRLTDSAPLQTVVRSAESVVPSFKEEPTKQDRDTSSNERLGILLEPHLDVLREFCGAGKVRLNVAAKLILSIMDHDVDDTHYRQQIADALWALAQDEASSVFATYADGRRAITWELHPESSEEVAALKEERKRKVENEHVLAVAKMVMDRLAGLKHVQQYLKTKSLYRELAEELESEGITERAFRSALHRLDQAGILRVATNTMSGGPRSKQVEYSTVAISSQDTKETWKRAPTELLSELEAELGR